MMWLSMKLFSNGIVCNLSGFVVLLILLSFISTVSHRIISRVMNLVKSAILLKNQLLQRISIYKVARNFDNP